jgi:predicted nucleic acid-binding protein
VACVIVLDACVLIAHLDATDSHHARATALLTSFGDTPLAASTLTVAEVLVGPTRVGRLAIAQVAIDRLGIIPQELPAFAAQELAQLRATTRLKMPDCCALWTALTNDSSPLATFDQQLTRVAAEKGIKVYSGE